MSWIQRLKNALIQDDPYPDAVSRLDRMDGLGPRAETTAPTMSQHEEPVTEETWLTTDCIRCDDARAAKLPFAESLVRRMILCQTCGNKRCPRATDHRLDCTDSNEPGQPGSVYTAYTGTIVLPDLMKPGTSKEG